MRDNTSDRRDPRVVAILQARMGSTRLPGKVLAALGESTLLEQILRRVSSSRAVTEIVVATSTLPADDAIAEVASARGFRCVRGSESDVLDRFQAAACEAEADVIVRLTGDNPLVNGPFVDMCVSEFLTADPPVSYLDTTSSGTFPYGLSVEVLSRAALETAWREATDAADREHVTLYVRERPDCFPALNLRCSEDHSSLRWTVDTPEDLQRMRRIFTAFGSHLEGLVWDELVGLLRKEPGIFLDG